MSVILTVRQLTEQIKGSLESKFPYVWVQGEVTNVTRPTSGHLYFSLKDETAQIQAVWFKGNQKGREAFDPLTGEVFEEGPRESLAKTLRTGMHAICAGRLTVYPPRGLYQLVVELAQEAGLGQRYLALEALRRKLAAKGYFHLDRKRSLPVNPQKISVITAPRGAAIRDFLSLSADRGTGAVIRIHPVPVQGEDAPVRIARALTAENQEGWADVLVLIRGGGSLEDLWAFNDERVANALFTSTIPVLAGIGHEVDTSLADMTADCRAATPSHAAQLLWPERSIYRQQVDDWENALSEAMARQLEQRHSTLDSAERTLAWLSPLRALDRQEERRASLAQRLHKALPHRLLLAENALAPLSAALQRYAAAPVSEKYHPQLDTLTLRLHAGIQRLLERDTLRLATARPNLAPLLARTELLFERLTLQLASLDPERPLQRGYASVRTLKGSFVRSIRELAPGSSVRIKISDGEFTAEVTALHGD